MLSPKGRLTGATISTIAHGLTRALANPEGAIRQFFETRFPARAQFLKIWRDRVRARPTIGMVDNPIDQVGVYFARQGELIRWPIEAFAGLLTGGQGEVGLMAETKRDFEALVRSESKRPR